jgi:UDP-2-acetamido-2-deoxy-ribo-hexuluronate aminotransferase
VFAHLELPEGSYPCAEAAARRVISLPMHAYLTEEQQRQVVTAVRESVEGDEGVEVVTRG